MNDLFGAVAPKMKAKKRPAKKVIGGRDPKCNRCYIPMVNQGNLDGGWEWLCLKCGLRHTKFGDSNVTTG
jgi:hypothetical protein